MSENGIVPSSCDRARSSLASWRTRLGKVLLSRPVGGLAGSILILIFLGCMSLSFGGLSIGCKTEPDGMICQEGKVSLQGGQELDVYYPIPYGSPPNLEIDADPDKYEIIEQKSGHFRIRCKCISIGGDGHHWNWKARGLKCPPPGTTPTVIVPPPVSPPDPPPPTSVPSSALPPPTPIQNP